MKRKFTHLKLLVFLFLAINFGANAQVQVGFGTEIDQHLPIEASTGYTYSQVIYLASEVYTSGDITELRWYFNGNSLSYSNDWTIYIGHTSKTEFADYADWVPVSSMTQVYSDVFTDPGTAGWITFDIDDWTYNGTDNIVVAVDENKPGQNTTGDDFYCTAVTDNRGIERHELYTNPDPNNPLPGNLKPYITNIIFGGITQSCPFPSGQTETNITATSAELGWTAGGTETTWNIEWGPTGFTQGSGTLISGTTDNPYTLTGLSANTTYDWYVQADCGGGDESLWTGPSTFTTDCQVYPAPFSEHFVSQSKPDCWFNTGPEPWHFKWTAGYGAAEAGDHTDGGGTNYAWIDGSSGIQTNELLTPFIDLSSLTTPRFKFYYFSNDTNNPGDNNTLFVDFWDGAAWNNLLTYAGDDPDWQEGLYNLSGYSITGDVQFRFVVTETSNEPIYNDILIDDIGVASCFAPIAQTETNITATSADLGWTAGGIETTWNIEWGPAGFTQGSGTLVSGLSTNSYSLTGLSSYTTYDWYVQADCGGELSNWTGPSTFTTACSTFTSPFAEDFSLADTPGCWDNPGPAFWRFSTNALYGASEAGDHTAGGGTNYAWMFNPSATSSNELLTPFIDVSGLTSPEFKFYYFSNNEDEPENHNTLTVDFWDGAAWNNLLTYTGNDSMWQVGIYDLSGYTITGDVQFRFAVSRMPSGFPSYNSILIDDVTVDEAPSCPEPTALTESNITDVSAELDWTAGGSETIWNIEWGPAGFTRGSGTLISGTTDKPYSLTGLTMYTSYDWYVQADCGGGDQSYWSAGSRFTSLCGVTTVPYFEDFDDVTTPDFPACMTVENTNGDAYEWVSAIGGLSSPNAARIQRNASLAMDDWFFTAGLQLTGGISYEVQFAYKVANTIKTEKLAVDWGDAAASTAMSGTPIFNNNNVDNTTWLAGNGTFTPATSGTYYVGFHGHSNANQWTLYVDNVKVIEAVATTTWSGTVDNDWETPGNWSNGIPSLSTDVSIPSGLTNYPTLTGFGNCNNITIQSGASLVGVDKLTVDGTATVEQTIPGFISDGDGSHYLSAPVDNFKIAGSDFEPISGTDDFFGWDETQNWWLNYYGSLLDTEFEVGKSYLVAYKSTITGAFTGSLNTSAVTKNLSYTHGKGVGWNLLGNPYTSAIDWDLLTKSADVYGVVYVLDGSDNTYKSWNGTSGGLTDGHIPANDGFFVKIGSIAGQSITMEVADQVHGVNPYLKNASAVTAENTLKVSITNGDFTNNTYIQFRSDASLEFDKAIDGYQLFGTGVGPQLFTRRTDIDYSINCVPFSTDEFDLNMGFVTKTAGTYTLSSEGINTFQNENFEVYLEDLTTGDLINLGTKQYTFDAQTEGNEDRFVLHFYSITSIWDKPDIPAAQIYSYNKTLYIKFDQLPADNSRVEVFNTYGQRVYGGELAPATLSRIQLHAKPGIYVVRLRNGSGLKTQKVSLQ